MRSIKKLAPVIVKVVKMPPVKDIIFVNPLSWGGQPPYTHSFTWGGYSYKYK